MTLREALVILQNQPAGGDPLEVLLACGSTALHVEKFLHAHLRQVLPERRIKIDAGLYGDVPGTLERAAEKRAHAVAVVLEWQDLDPRLGYRQLGGWGPAQESDFGSTVSRSLARILAALERLPKNLPVGVVLPTLPLAPAFQAAGWQAGAARWDIESSLAQFARGLVSRQSTRVANPDRLRLNETFDLRNELIAGLPYHMEHASVLGRTLALLLYPPAPKKGLITDLDDTLWSGIVGEVGSGGVKWDLSSRRQIHGLYQQLLRALGEAGTLLAVASKNSRAVVDEALNRADIVLPASRLFPVEASWDPKSGSVSRILKAWNVAADSVVFVDDSAFDLAEVKAVHPEITCMQFPPGDPEAALALMRQIRDLFGKPYISEEDGYRLESLRRVSDFQEAAGAPGATLETLLESLNAEIHLDFETRAEDSRALELLDKSNQFNLNGVRRTAADWSRRQERPGAFLGTVSYQDKFGRLGKIAVIEGRAEQSELHIETWVMSCRAFSRRIEHRCLLELFNRFNADRALLYYTATPRNGALQEFIERALGEKPEAAPVLLERASFEAGLPALYQTVRLETREAAIHGSNRL